MADFDYTCPGCNAIIKNIPEEQNGTPGVCPYCNKMIIADMGEVSIFRKKPNQGSLLWLSVFGIIWIVLGIIFFGENEALIKNMDNDIPAAISGLLPGITSIMPGISFFIIAFALHSRSLSIFSVENIILRLFKK